MTIPGENEQKGCLKDQHFKLELCHRPLAGSFHHGTLTPQLFRFWLPFGMQSAESVEVKPSAAQLRHIFTYALQLSF